MPDGFLNLYKPAGWTSHDCVAKLRRLLSTKKIGHAGTLDPAATGVLPVAVGRATRLLQYLPSDKAYRAVVQLGITTDTDDLDGHVLTQTPADHLTQADVIEQLAQFQGEIVQRPPMYSAVHVKGQRLYDLARRGSVTTADVPSRRVMVHGIDVVDWQGAEAPTITLEITCGAGTYIRSIARDLGQSLGVGGTLASLLRTQSSGFSLDTSISFEDLTAQPEMPLIAPAVAMAHLPSIVLSAEAGRRWCLGQRLPMDPTLALEEPLRVVTETCPFLGIGVFRIKDERPHLVPKMVFARVS